MRLVESGLLTGFSSVINLPGQNETGFRQWMETIEMLPDLPAGKLGKLYIS
jgi:hypothetical protein